MVALLLSAAAAAAFVFVLPSVAAQKRAYAPAQSTGDLSSLCTPGAPDGAAGTVNVTLKTKTGHIVTPDGNTVFMWAYGKDPGGFQMPGPILCADEGDTVNVTLNNSGGLGENASILFPGQGSVSATGSAGAVNGLFTKEAPPGENVTYSFTAGEPGTYLYESGTDPEKQVEMGLYGALIVYPKTSDVPGGTAGHAYAYDATSSEYNPDREFLILLHEIDPDAHRKIELGKKYDFNSQHDKYWTINGRSFPDTISENGVSWLPGQPYGALVQIEPYDASTNPLPALIRYANAGQANHPFHPHGNHLNVIARDGRLLTDPFEDFTRTIGSGQTYDLTVEWTNVDNYSSTSNPVPVEIPGLQDLVFKDDATFYSGSPYLGEQDEFPVGVTQFNQCGEFYFPWHSHALMEFTNFDEGFGGMATLLRVDPPGGCP